MSNNENERSYRLRRPGGDIDRSRIFNAPGVVLALVGAMAAAFVFFALAPARTAARAALAGAVIPARLTGDWVGEVGVLSALSPLIAHMFIHDGIMHLAMNALFLLAFGAPVARRMGASNALQSSGAFAAASMFVTFFLLAGVAGALFFVLLHPHAGTMLVGASGGVSGLLGALVRFAFNRSTLFGPDTARFSPLASQPVALWTGIILATNNPLSAAALGALAGGASIAWEAHLGGYLFGLLTYPFFERAARGMR